MPKIFNKITGRMEELPYDEAGINKAKQMEQTGQGTMIPENDARKRSEMTYG